jgi:SAM-dependent methyltransferase
MDSVALPAAATTEAATGSGTTEAAKKRIHNREIEAKGARGFLKKFFDKFVEMERPKVSKWSGLKYIRGIDISPAEIDEARRRHVESFPHLACEFEVCDTFGTETYTSTRIYDSITCMFAIHFFFENESMLDTFMSNVSSNLKKGGCFIGTVPCAQRIHDARSKSNKFVDIVHLYETPQPFGSAYTCNIKDTVTAKTNVSNGAIEYLVFEDTLIASAEKFGLSPFRSQIPANLIDLFETSANGVLKHFEPRFAATTHPDLGNVSRLFAAFAFMKI